MRRFLLITIGIGCLLVGLTQPVTAQDPREETLAEIAAPLGGAQVSGQVSILGSASHPSLFVGYELEYDNMGDPSTIWLPIGQRVTQQVTNGTLGIWDTVALRVPDGQFQLRLRVFLSGDLEPVEYIVQNIQVTNTAPTQLPTVDANSAPPTELPSPDGAESTPLIQQPPTSTPRPTLESLVNVNVESGSESGSSTISVDVDRFQNAFCNGALISLGLFMVLGAYMWVRNRMKPTARRFWWQIRNEFDQDR